MNKIDAIRQLQDNVMQLHTLARDPDRKLQFTEGGDGYAAMELQFDILHDLCCSRNPDGYLAEAIEDLRREALASLPSINHIAD